MFSPGQRVMIQDSDNQVIENALDQLSMQRAEEFVSVTNQLQRMSMQYLSEFEQMTTKYNNEIARIKSQFESLSKKHAYDIENIKLVLHAKAKIIDENATVNFIPESRQ